MIYLYNSMEVGAQRVTSVGFWLEIVGARERGVASLGLVPAKSSFGGFPSYQSENLEDLPSNRLKRIELSLVSLVLFTAAEIA